MAPSQWTVQAQGDFTVSIGSASDCEIHAPEAEGGVGRYASLRRVGDRLFIRPLGAGEGLRLNDTPVPNGQWTELQSAGDQLAWQGVPIEIGPAVFHGRPRFDLVALDIEYRLGRSRILLQRTDVAIARRRFTAIMGPAGCGKTTLLKCLNGCLAPTAGTVWLSRDAVRYDIRGSSAQAREWIGYVPQEDVLIPELTVRYALDCRLALRYPDMARDMRARVIARTLQQLGFTPGPAAETYLDTRIADLSGGERRKANIAHELVLQPLILLLDEPTSGLSSLDAESIVRSLRAICADQRVAVAAVIHQPSAETFAQFDDLILMNRRGRVVYHGEARAAARCLALYAGQETEPDGNPAEFLLETVDRHGVDDFVGHEAFRARYGTVLARAAQPPAGESARPRAGRMPPFLRNGWTLLRRSVRVFLQDRFALGIAFGQVPLIAALMGCSFHGFEASQREWDTYARYVANVQSRYDALFRIEPFDNDRDAPLWQTLHNDSVRAAREEAAAPPARRISASHAAQRGAVYFMLVAAAVWFGVLGASREVVCDRALLRREVRTGVPLVSWLAAKLAAQGLVAGAQCALLAALVAPFLLGLSGAAVGQAWLAMWMTSTSAACVGLLASACSPTYRVALTLVPLIMIPQFLFGGFVRSESEMGAAGRTLSRLTLQRWGFERISRADPYAETGVLLSETALREETEGPVARDERTYQTFEYRLRFLGRPGETNARRHPLVGLVRFDATGLVPLHFGAEAPTVPPAVALAGLGAAALLGAWAAARWRV